MLKFSFSNFFKPNLFLKKSPYKLLKSASLMLSSFIITWYLANYFSKDFLGQFQLILSIFGLMAIFTIPGMRYSLVTSLGNNYFSSFDQAIRYSSRFSLIGSGILIVLSCYYFFQNSFSVSYSLIFLGLIFPFLESYKLFESYFHQKLQIKTEAKYILLLRTTLVIFVLLTVFFFGEHLFLLVFVYFSVILFFRFQYVLRVRKRISIKSKNLQHRTDLTLLSRAIQISKLDCLYIITNHIDKLIIGFFLSPTLLAIYSIGIMIPEKLKSLVSPILYLLYPGYVKSSKKLNFNQIIFIVLVSTLLCIVVIFLLPFAYVLFFPNFINDVQYGILYSFSLVFLPINMVFNYFFIAKNFKKAIIHPVLWSQIIMLIIIGPGIYYYGLIGAIFSRILSQVIWMILNCYYWRKFNKDEI